MFHFVFFSFLYDTSFQYYIIKNTTFQNCSANQFGGGINLIGGNLILDNVTFITNKAISGGSDIYF